MKSLKYFLAVFYFIPTLAFGYFAEQKFTIEASLFGNAGGYISYTIKPDHYDITSAVATNGFLGSLYSYQISYLTKGLIKENQPIAQSYEYLSATSSGQRSKLLTMDEQGNPKHRTTHRDGKTKEINFEKPTFDFDVPDMQTAFVILIKQFKDFQFCDMDKTVFDGKKHYKMSFRDLGRATLDDLKVKTSEKLWKCALQLKAADEEDADFLWKMTAKHPIVFWIAKDDQTNIPYIVKIQIDSTPIGTIKVYTDELNLSDD